MNTIRLVEPPKAKFSWAKAVLALKAGDKIKVKNKYAKTVTPIISTDVKYRAPDRKYTTDSKSEPNYLIIERTN